MRRLEQELCLFCCHLKLNVFPVSKEVKNLNFEIDSEKYIEFFIKDTNFRTRCIKKSIFPVNLLSIDLRCFYKINNSLYSYDIAVLDIPITTIKHAIEQYKYNPVPLYVGFPVNWLMPDANTEIIDFDTKNNEWIDYKKCLLFIPSPVVLKNDIDTSMYTDLQQVF